MVVSAISEFYRFYVFSDAEDAIEERDGYQFDGYSLRVEKPHGGSGGRGRRGGGGGGYGGYRGGGGGGGYGSFRGGPPGRPRGPPPGGRRSDHRILISGELFLSLLFYLNYKLLKSCLMLIALTYMPGFSSSTVWFCGFRVSQNECNAAVVN